MSISSLSVMVIDWPATACFRSPSWVTMRATVLSRPDGNTRTRSPGFTTPPTMRPEKPRKSRFGRLTHCTGMRKGPRCTRSLSISTVSRCSISVGPPYQGVLALGSVMLSPFSADIGIATNSAMPICFAKSRYSLTMRSYTSRE